MTRALLASAVVMDAAGPPPPRYGFRTAPIPRGPWRDGAGLPTSGP